MFAVPMEKDELLERKGADQADNEEQYSYENNIEIYLGATYDSEEEIMKLVNKDKHLP